MVESDRGSLSRRGFACLALWGAAGLSFLPGCLRKKQRDEPIITCYITAEPPPDTGGGLLERWARLGEVWRGITRILRAPEGERIPEKVADALRAELRDALDALPAWPELRALCEERVRLLEPRIDYTTPRPECYMAPLELSVTVYAHQEIEEQLEALEQLVEQGTLAREAAEKAARVIAQRTQILHSAPELAAEYSDFVAKHAPAGSEEPPPEQMDEWRAKEDAWLDGLRERKPGEGAVLAGQRAVEMTISDLGYLAGPPQENEGFEDAPAAEEDDDQ